MEHPNVFRPQEYAVYSDEKMGKSTLFSSERMLVGLNAFEPGQEHKLHAHEDMDKLYHVIQGSGTFLLEDDRLLGEGVESGGGVPEVAVESQVVRAGRVEADHDEVRELGPRRFGAGE